MKGIIFDMDGILFDTERLSATVMKEVGLEMGIVVSDELIRSLCSSTQEIYNAAMQQEFGESFDLNYFDKQCETRFLALINQELPEKTGLHEVLEEVHSLGLKCAIASSTKRERILEYLNRANITHQFDVIFGGDSVIQSKPNPEIYIKSADALGILPSECYAVEDSRNGIKSASSAGCATIMVPDLTPPDEEINIMTTYICDSLLDVIDILKKSS